MVGSLAERLRQKKNKVGRNLVLLESVKRLKKKKRYPRRGFCVCYGYSNYLIHYCFDYAFKENVEHCEVVTVVKWLF